MSNFKQIALTIALCALGTTSASAAPSVLGLDSSLNLLTFGNFNAWSSDVEGRIAVGGNANITGYSVNWTNPSSPSQRHFDGSALTVAGNLNFSNGAVFGNTVIGGNFTSNYSGAFLGTGNLAVGQTLNISSGVSALGAISGGTVIPNAGWNPAYTQNSAPLDLGFDFTGQKARLTQLSSQLDAYATTGSTNQQYGTLFFDASNSNGINIFDISAADAALNMQINGLGAGGTAIINIHGTNIDFGNHGYQSFGHGRVLFNLPEALMVAANYVEGSLFAPKAAVTANNGVIWGQVVANSWDGNTQINDAAFTGNLPAVPEPETYAMFLAGLGLMGAATRRRRQI